MQEKKLTLFAIEGKDGSTEYQVSELDIPNAEPLASYDDISELYPNFYNATSTYDVSSFTANSAVQSFYATTPTRTVSDAAKARISVKNSINQSGEGNSQFGTMWIHSDELKQSKKIRVTDKIPEGWEKGRKMKFNED